MVAGADVCDEDAAPIIVGDASISNVPDFRYLGSLIDNSGRSSRDIEARISAASRAFGALRRPVFLNAHLSIMTKRLVFNACVLSLLLYGAECWVPLQQDVRHLSSFYLACIRSILGISK